MAPRADDDHFPDQNDRERVHDVSISIVNWNKASMLMRCLSSFEDMGDEVSAEIIVVDNASTDNSVALTREQFPHVRLILNDENKGFAAAHNQAIRASNGRYVLILNNDAWVKPDTAVKMAHFADSHPEVGIVGPQVLTKGGYLQITYGPTPTLWRILFPDRKYEQQAETLAWGQDLEECERILEDFIPKYGFDHTHEVDNVSGVCMLARRSMMDDIGLLDEGFFIYYEDLDWCVRASKNGYKIYYYTDAIIHHELHKLVDKPDHFMVAARRGQIRFVGKHEGLLAMWALGFITIGATAGKLVWLGIKSLLRGEQQDSRVAALQQLIKEILKDLLAGAPEEEQLL